MMEQNQNKLEIQGVDYHYGQRQVLTSIDLTVAAQGFVAILGPNGCGKTTLIKTVSRHLVPRVGSINLSGRDLTTFTSRDLATEVAVVAQESSVAFAFTAWEIVLMGRTPYLGRMQTESERDHQVALEAMEMTGTTHLRERPITDLSGGEKQSVMIAQALAQEPSLLILDEPTQHLDLSRQLEMMELLKDLNADGMTILTVLHDINLAARYADTLVLMKKGSVVAAGPPAALLTPDLIQEVFDVTARVEADSTTGMIHVDVLAARPQTLSAGR